MGDDAGRGKARALLSVIVGFMNFSNAPDNPKIRQPRCADGHAMQELVLMALNRQP